MDEPDWICFNTSTALWSLLLFQVKPVRKANRIVLEEVRAEEEEFRHEAEGAGLSIEKTKLDHYENVKEEA